MASASVDFPRSFGPYSTFRPGPNSISASANRRKVGDMQSMEPQSAPPCEGLLALQELVQVRERAGRPRLLGLVIRVCDQAVEARDGVLDHRRQIVGEDSARTGLQPQVRSVHQQDARAAVGGVGALKVTQDALDLALLGQGHGHVEVQPDHMAIEVRSGQQLCATR